MASYENNISTNFYERSHHKLRQEQLGLLFMGDQLSKFEYLKLAKKCTRRTHFYYHIIQSYLHMIRQLFQSHLRAERGYEDTKVAIQKRHLSEAKCSDFLHLASGFKHTLDQLLTTVEYCCVLLYRQLQNFPQTTTNFAD